MSQGYDNEVIYNEAGPPVEGRRFTINTLNVHILPKRPFFFGRIICLTGLVLCVVSVLNTQSIISASWIAPCDYMAESIIEACSKKRDRLC